VSDVPAPTEALETALRRVGDRWTLLVVAALLEGPRRFGELAEAVPGVATNVLTSRLRELERHGLVVAAPYSERPLRVEYRLTAAGTELAGALRLLAAWAGSGEGPRHAACGTEVEVRWWCPTCQRVAGDEDEEWV
jgi:DNA-binding HxlR family transcriptional regulator